ncbi:MAG: dephospho-CoA kinase [Bacteroidales bacterium]|nr:dephospho-CoA kinase [Lachnoclostridium sp.]MCM1385678.1 dephospho-CoA kinase [Lachnoclostridium sp.]MCM1463854.1 dephospho-CoA kinase [Bacteroidales bacterium]
MRFIGITGGVGSGKTELLRYIRKHYKCEVYLADEVAHEVKLPGTKCYKELTALLGSEIIKSDGQIDKAVMADKIFADKQLLMQVNAIIHPAVREFLTEKFTRAKQLGEAELFFVEAALLIEAGYAQVADELWYVHVDREIRAKRLAAARGYSAEKFDSITENQLSEEEFRKHCGFVIDNSGSLEDSYRQIDKKLEAFTWRE